jgi:hypothetical protein
MGNEWQDSHSGNSSPYMEIGSLIAVYARDHHWSACYPRLIQFRNNGTVTIEFIFSVIIL